MPLEDEPLPLTTTPDGLEEFVNTVLLESLTAAGKERAWCPEWSNHPDALHRLTAIYEQWELLTMRGMTLHDFFRDVLDYHLPYLVGKDIGAFSGCAYGQHRPHKRLDETPA